MLLCGCCLGCCILFFSWFPSVAGLLLYAGFCDFWSLFGLFFLFLLILRCGLISWFWYWGCLYFLGYLSLCIAFLVKPMFFGHRLMRKPPGGELSHKNALLGGCG